MQPKFTLKKRGVFYLLSPILFAFLSLLSGKIQGQTISTASGTNYLGNYSINNPGSLVQTFVIENTNPTTRLLTDISMQMAPYFTATAGAPSAITLYYSATSLSGPVTAIGAPDWTQIATGNTTVPAALSTIPILTGMSFVIPAGAQYRFAVVASKGMAFSFSPTPTPNIFTVSGVSLKVGNNQIAAQDIGYAGVFPALPSGNHPSFFGGSVTLTAAVPCAGTPTPGNTVSSVPSVCPATNFTLSLQNLTDGTGVTYQWQSSPDGTTWSNIAGATSSVYITQLAAATYYRCDVTCSGNTATSAPVQVLLTPPSGCYCTPPGSDCTDNDVITRVRISTLDNTSTCSAGPPVGYANYTNTVAAPTVYAGAANPITVNVPTVWTEQVAVWIDYNQNGQFEAAEFTSLGNNVGNGGVLTRTIAIPSSALNGTTRMRVRVRFSTAWTSGQACTGVTFGETEDYNVNIAPCVPVMITSSPASSSITCGANTSFTVAASGSIPAYSWEYRPDANAAWQNVVNGGIYSGATTATLTLTNATAAYSGYQYRALVSGGCSAIDASGIATLTVNPIQPTVSPSSATICTGSVQQLSLTNTVSAPTTVTFTPSSGLPLSIPDGTPSGVWSALTVSGIPAGSVITDMSVKVNINHTWVGDLEINLLAPNAANMNLIGELDGGTGSNGTDHFVNTVVSSSGTVALSGFAAPRTGTFRADRLLGYGPANGPGGTGTGYQTVSGITWAQLQTTMNGTWSLGLSDWYNLDAGTLTDWSLSITYVAPNFAQGIWDGPAGTIFTDVDATIAYTGTPATTVYVKPAATTNYSVYFTTTNPCTSATTIVPVTVNTPVAGLTVSPATRSVCLGGSTTFSASVTGGSPVTYQWQRSIDGGTNWSNISGATSATLTISGVTSAMTGYKYRVVASVGSCGSVTSAATGTLTVLALPNVTIASPVVNLIPGRNTTITGTSSPAAAANGWAWTLNGAAISGSTNTQTASVDALGTYQATVTDVNGCVNTTNQLVIGAEASDKLWIYPNPTPGAFQVRLYYAGNAAEKRVVSIYNQKGQLITSRTFDLNYRSAPYQSMNFDFTGMARGVYVVKVAHEYGGNIVSGLVLVQ